MNVLLQLFERECGETDFNKRKVLRLAADKIHLSMKAFNTSPTDDNLSDLTGAWVRGHKVLADYVGGGPKGGSSGALKDGALLRVSA